MILTPRPSTLKLYGLTLEDWEDLWAAQGGKCPMCQKNFTRTRRPVIDHDHRTWKVRGLACGPCNVKLGYMHDNADWFERAAAYLRTPPSETVFDTPRLHVSAPPLEIA